MSRVVLLGALILTFPGYSQDLVHVNEIVIKVKGMTCTGCASNIEQAVGQLDGVKSVDASHSEGTATVKYVPAKLEYDKIVSTINEKGYKVVDDSKQSYDPVEDPGNISFYKVPLVCSAAPTLGCGSRSKPVLATLEEGSEVLEAWLNKQGTVIAVVWSEEADLQKRREVILDAFSQHQVNASELLMNDHRENLVSFANGVGWYRGSNVNALSKEEAGIIANQILKPVKEKAKLNFLDEQKLREDITERLYDFFVNYESLDQLGDPDAYKAILTEFITYGESVVGNGNMPTLDELWNSCSNAAKSCDHEDCGASCKVPKG